MNAPALTILQTKWKQAVVFQVYYTHRIPTAPSIRNIIGVSSYRKVSKISEIQYTNDSTVESSVGIYDVTELCIAKGFVILQSKRKRDYP